MPTNHAASKARLRLLTLVQQGQLDASEIRPPLTDEERAWIAAGPRPVCADRQPQPHPGRQDVSPVARRRFLATFDAQDAVGLETYGQRLQTQNGRSFARDAMEELVDLSKYITGLEMETEELGAEVIRLRTRDYALHSTVARLEGTFMVGHPDHKCSGCQAPREDGWQ